jgi:hypothetical protein
VGFLPACLGTACKCLVTSAVLDTLQGRDPLRGPAEHALGASQAVAVTPKRRFGVTVEV